jgi:hypothetical protein
MCETRVWGVLGGYRGVLGGIGGYRLFYPVTLPPGSFSLLKKKNTHIKGPAKDLSTSISISYYIYISIQGGGAIIGGYR